MNRHWRLLLASMLLLLLLLLLAGSQSARSWEFAQASLSPVPRGKCKGGLIFSY